MIAVSVNAPAASGRPGTVSLRDTSSDRLAGGLFNRLVASYELLVLADSQGIHQAVPTAVAALLACEAVVGGG